MMPTLAFLLGVLIGSLPTAGWLARLRGIDLRQAGTANPGTNNALQLGGPVLAASVLAVEIAKGAAAVWLGQRLGADSGAALAGVGATVGNVYNPWYGFRGGKGLAITGGTILAAWPLLVPVLALVIGVSVAVMRRSGPAALITLFAYLGAALVGLEVTLPGRGVIDDAVWAVVLAAGQSAVMAPKHLTDTLRRFDRRTSPG
ncbi:MAG TPA: glycerol-3-phosphate acyltransferase [Acidimicrobiia bacterium]|nr:glycerol-3-phosphate acyltransferase [Acidimicrobiia bacterium]